MSSEKLPSITSKELIRVLKKIDFEEHHQKGSHLMLKRPSDKRRVVVPVHPGKTLKIGTLKGILDDVGLSKEELNELL
jgi:predicted RNA binding protein YcfA (HicA-like mRNA interferase family)